MFDEWLDFVVTSLARDDDTYQTLVEDLQQHVDGAGDARDCLGAYSAGFGHLVEIMESTTVPGTDAPADILGAMYEHYGATSDHFGQYFTPANVALAKAEMEFPDAESIRDATPEDPLVIGDPACGSGRLPWYGLHRLREVAPETPSLVVARDIDNLCARMAVVNFALWDMPAYIVHGNSLTYETWSVWRVDRALEPLLRSEQEGVVTTVPPSEAPIRTKTDEAVGSRDGGAETVGEQESANLTETPESELNIEQRSQASLQDFNGI